MRTPVLKRPSTYLFGLGILLWLFIALLLRFAAITDHLYHGLLKDPERSIPAGNSIVAPADGLVLYVKRITNGIVPEIIKKGVPIPLHEHLKTQPTQMIRDGYLIGIFMTTHGVHINRSPVSGVLKKRIVFNGPHMSMSETEQVLILTQLIPGWVSMKKLFGFAPYAIEDKADYVLKSARETLILEDKRNTDIYVTRIADFHVGKILTWVKERQLLRKGQKLGMITWGSQTDVIFEHTKGLNISVESGDRVYGGETILATY